MSGSNSPTPKSASHRVVEGPLFSIQDRRPLAETCTLKPGQRRVGPTIVQQVLLPSVIVAVPGGGNSPVKFLGGEGKLPCQINLDIRVHNSPGIIQPNITEGEKRDKAVHCDPGTSVLGARIPPSYHLWQARSLFGSPSVLRLLY